MDLIQLDIFCAVFKERSFSRAAEALGLAQPTVSIRIKEFEEELGTPLFNRLGRDIEPTAAGRFLHEQALPLLSQRRRLSERMTGFLNRIGGPLTIGTSAAAGEHLLPGIMMAFQRQHPEVHLRLRFFGDSLKTLEELRNGEIDLGVIVATKGRDDVAAEPFDQDELVLITPASAPWQAGATLSLAELKRLPLIVLEPGSAIRAALEQALAGQKTRLSDLNVVGQFGRTGAIKAAVKEGYGMGFVSRGAVADELAAGTLHSATVPELGPVTLSFTIVRERRRDLSPTARAFLDHLRRSAPHGLAATGR